MDQWNKLVKKLDLPEVIHIFFYKHEPCLHPSKKKLDHQILAVHLSKFIL